jgi:S1-C subfamily serine protease
MLLPRIVLPITATAALLLGLFGSSVPAQPIDRRVLDAETRRIAVIERIKPAVVAVFAGGGQGGGSGVLIDKAGYALTNFHVVQPAGPVMQCGLPDGVLYDAVLVGLDRVGDTALIKLLPKKDGQEFPAAVLGDSDKVRAGDWSLALGNPFLLATDFSPTVTYGLVSGVHRYQYPESQRGLLEYTDCIQVDTSINPGNSGGPLFNLDGELIGINGRISLEKRNRVNSGVGYAISINQIKNFLGHLRAGLEADHASLGALVETRAEEGVQTSMVVTQILENSDAHRRGLEINDEIVSFAGRPVTSPNHYHNILGIFPKGWRVPLVYRRENDKHEILVRLMGLQRQELDDEGRPKPPAPSGRQPTTPPKPSPAAKFYEAKPGFANYYFNRQERDRLWSAFQKHGDFTTRTGAWGIDAELTRAGKKVPIRAAITDEVDPGGKAARTVVLLSLPGGTVRLDPLKPGQDTETLTQPKDSGGLLLALYQYRRLLTLGAKGFEGQFNHGGREPFYPMPADGSTPPSLAALRVDTEMLNTEHGAIPAKWFFSPADGTLLGAEVTAVRDEDPCELYFGDYRPVDGRLLPHRIEIRYGNGPFGVLTVNRYQLAAGK